MNNYEEDTMNGTITDSDNTITASKVQTIPDLTNSLNKKQETRKLLGTMLLIVALFLGFVGAWVTFLAPEEKQVGTPRPVMEVSTRGEYVYDTMNYMTDSIAYFSDSEDLYLCLAVCGPESDVHYTALCINSADYDKYSDYIDQSYSVDATHPEPVTLCGRSEIIDDTLSRYISEGIDDFYGAELAARMHSVSVSPVYIVIDDIAVQYYCYILSVVLFILSAAALIAGCFLVFAKSQVISSSDKTSTGQIYSSLPCGIIGAVLGAAVGGVIWFGVGLTGLIVGYIGFLVFFLSILGFICFCKTKPKLGIILGFILSVLSIITVSVSLSSVLGERQNPRNTWINIALGILFVVLGCILRISNSKKKS